MKAKVIQWNLQGIVADYDPDGQVTAIRTVQASFPEAAFDRTLRECAEEAVQAGPTPMASARPRRAPKSEVAP